MEIVSIVDSWLVGMAFQPRKFGTELRSRLESRSHELTKQIRDIPVNCHFGSGQVS